MQLKLTVSSVHAQSLGTEATVFFRLRGGTIGRARDNDWILPDPERVVSSHHARLLYDQGSYFVQDTSTNGTYLNQLDAPLPQGQPVALTHGDTLYIGEYEIHVELAEETPRYPSSGPAIDSAEPTEADFVAEPYTPQIGSKQTRGLDSDWESAPAVESDPWRAQHSPPPQELEQGQNSAPTQSDHLPADRQHFRPPQATPELITEDIPPLASETLPDDWWSADENPAAAIAPPQAPPTQPATFAAPPPVLTTPERMAPVIPESVPASEQNQPPTAEQQPPTTTHITAPPTPGQRTTSPPAEPPGSPVANSAETDQLIDAFFAGLGIDPAQVAQAQREALFRQLGRLIRLLTQGTIEVLQARSTLKGEFRLSQTIVRPAENNPLKFSLGADQALQQFFVERRPGFMGAEAAFTEALKDIKQHELAVVAGMRAAFDCLLRKLAPETVEAALRASGKRSPMLFGDKSWDFYKTYYSEFKANAGDDFQGIFGEDFVRAYEEQITQLTSRGNGQ